MFLKPTKENPVDQEINFDDANNSKRMIRNVIHVEKGSWHHLLVQDPQTGEESEIIVPSTHILFIKVTRSKNKRSLL